MRFEGIASTTTVDREGERMTAAALEGMARAREVELREGHGGERIGVVEACSTDGRRLQVAGRLEEGNPRARAVWAKLCAGVRLALSVGGRKRVVRRWSPVAGRYVRMIEEARLEHVAVVPAAEARNAETEVVASRRSEVEGRRSEVEGRKAEVASRRSEVASRRSEVGSAEGEVEGAEAAAEAAEGEVTEAAAEAAEGEVAEAAVIAGRSRALRVERGRRSRREEDQGGWRGVLG